jgi:beta-lactamase regulating signal transducer with metallopeptidase domain
MTEWILLMALKSTVLLALAGAVVALLRGSSSAVRHLVWLLALCSLLLLPLLSLSAPEWRPRAAENLQKAFTARGITVVDVVADGGGASRPWDRAAAWLWAAGVLLLLVRTASARVRAAGMAARATPYGNAAGTPARISPEVDVPLVCGLFQPVILLPEEAREWDPERLRLVLAHEQMHVARGDTWTLAAAQAACALYWPNPLVWWALSRLRRECEQACDDAVLAGGEKPAVYAGHLVEIVRGLVGPPSNPEGGIAMIGISEIERRVAALLNPKRNRRAAGRMLTAGAVVAAIAVLAPVAAWRAPAQQTGASLSGVVKDPSGAVVDGARVTLIFAGQERREFSITNAAGEFRFAPLPEGFYGIQVAKPGFALHEAGEFAVSQSGPPPMEVVLNLGRIQERLEVRGGPVAAANPPAPSAAAPTRIRVGGNVQAAKMVYQERPLYPADCKAERVQGTVLLQAVISREGVPLNLTPINQLVDPRLVRAATDAVKQWRYEPTLLNGEPVEIITQVQVNFTLAP